MKAPPALCTPTIPPFLAPCAQDEARAKRYQDEHEVAQRRKEAAEKERREAMQRELEASRLAAKAWKAQQAEEAARLEAEEAARIAAVARQKKEAEHLEVGWA